jgi:hypothetical protein
VDDESLVALPNVLLRAEVHTRAAHRFRRRVRHLNAGGRPGPVYDPARAMKKGIWAGCFRADLPLEGRFALARAAGFDGIELTADDALLGDESRLRGLAELARRTVPVCSLMCGGARKLGSPDEGERRAAVEHVRRAITAATVLGTDTLLVIPAYVDAQVTYEQAWERGQAGLRALLPAAEEHGVTLAVENVWNRFLLSPLEMARFVDDVGSASVRAYFDVGNVLPFAELPRSGARNNRYARGTATRRPFSSAVRTSTRPTSSSTMRRLRAQSPVRSISSTSARRPASRSAARARPASVVRASASCASLAASCSRSAAASAAVLASSRSASASLMRPRR